MSGKTTDELVKIARAGGGLCWKVGKGLRMSWLKSQLRPSDLVPQ